MIKFENTEVLGLEAAIRGMRNPKESWSRSDSFYMKKGHTAKEWAERWAAGYEDPEEVYCLGPNDLKLAASLAKGGPVHAKYRRMIQVYVDITAPLYWWKEADTYKVGTVANSCSTMHMIHTRDLTIDDFSHEHLVGEDEDIFLKTIDRLNANRKIFLAAGDREAWYRMIQLLGTNYNQKRTWMTNYEVLAGIYPMRKNHKLDEWHDFCHWIENLPYSEIITGVENNE